MSSRNRNLRIISTFWEQMLQGSRFFHTKSKPDLSKIRPMILKRIEDRAEKYPVRSMLPVAQEVLNARKALYSGVSTLMQQIPVWVCKYCREVYVGEGGHLIKTCQGKRHHTKDKIHTWVKGSINDVIVPVQTYHLQKMFQDVIEHQQRFDHERIPATVELCLQAGAIVENFNDQTISSSNDITTSKPLSIDDLRVVATGTLRAWETLRSGVDKLLLVYPARVCKHCSEVHVGPSGHKGRMCGVFKYENFRGPHFWQKAAVDDLVRPNLGWYRRRQDPPILVDKGRGYYGRAPVVVDLCSKGGAVIPSKYFCVMKYDGLSPAF